MEHTERAIKVINDVLRMKEELDAASDYIKSNEVIVIKEKNSEPTVIEYKGVRFIREPQHTADQRKG